VGSEGEGASSRGGCPFEGLPVPPREKTGRDRGGECLFAQASSPIVAESPIDSEFQFIIESGLQRSDFLSFSRGIFFCTCVPSGFSGYVCSFRGRRRVLVGTERLVGSCRVVCVLETLTLGVIDCWVLLASCRCHGHAAVRLISHQPTVLFLSEQTSHQYFPLTTNQH
jgi:hypothetical protein